MRRREVAETLEISYMEIYRWEKGYVPATRYGGSWRPLATRFADFYDKPVWDLFPDEGCEVSLEGIDYAAAEWPYAGPDEVCYINKLLDAFREAPLNEDEAFVVAHHYGFAKQLSLKGISKLLGVSSQRAAAIDREARIKLWRFGMTKLGLMRVRCEMMSF